MGGPPGCVLVLVSAALSGTLPIERAGRRGLGKEGGGELPLGARWGLGGARGEGGSAVSLPLLPSLPTPLPTTAHKTETAIVLSTLGFCSY